MHDKKYEIHIMPNPGLPFVFHTDLINRGNVYTHWHENTEFLYCINGSGSVFSDSKEIPMNQGDFIVINSKNVHSISSAKKVLYYCLIVENSFFKDNGINIDNIKFEEKFSDNIAANLIEQIDRVYSTKTAEYFIAGCRSSVLSFITHVTTKHSNKITPHKSNSKSTLAVLSAIDYIDKHFEKKLTVDEISSIAGYSKFHFVRLFKETTGYTITEHIKAKRCEKAKKLLKTTTKPIYEICLECGFDNNSYFSKTFKQAYGSLPYEYRKKHTN